MSNDRENQPAGSGKAGEEDKKGYKSYLNYIKDNKSSKISAWIGKASDIYGEINKYACSQDEAVSGSIFSPDEAIKQGALTKAVEIVKMEWMKAKLESEGPIELAEKYNARMRRMNDEYRQKNVLFPNVTIVGFMKEEESKVDRLLITKSMTEPATQVFAVDPGTGIVVEVFEIAAQNCLFELKRPD